MKCFTIADGNYRAAVAVLASSLRLWHPHLKLVWYSLESNARPVPVPVSGADDAFEVRSLPDEPWVRNDADLTRRFADFEGRALGSFFKPLVLRELLRSGNEPVVFLDPDLCLIGAIPELFAPAAGGLPFWLQQAELVLTPHLVTPPATPDRVERERNILVSGTFNAGLIACRPSPAVLSFVDWWSQRVLERHAHDQAAGLYWDQKWLDFAPVHVPATTVIRDGGINLGHWRLLEAPPVEACRLLHLSGFPPESPEAISRYTTHLGHGTVPVGYCDLYRRYSRLLSGQEEQTATLAPVPAEAAPEEGTRRAPLETPGRIAFATAAAKAEWALVRTLWESFNRHHPEIPFLALLTDEPDGRFDPAREPFEVLRLGDLGLTDVEGLARTMGRMEFTYALTPDLLRALHRKGYDRACFLKQESLVAGPMRGVADQLAGCSILLTPHLPAALQGNDAFGREANILQSGIYNVGFIGVRDTAEGARFLDWWGDRTHRCCRWDVAGGVHFEQRWLDLVPGYFDDVGYVRDKGFNIGHWNLPELAIERRGGRFVHAEGECSFFRLSGFDYDQPLETSRYRRSLTVDQIGAARDVFRSYRDLLTRHGFQESRHWPWHFQAPSQRTPSGFRRFLSLLRRSLRVR